MAVAVAVAVPGFNLDLLSLAKEEEVQHLSSDGQQHHRVHRESLLHQDEHGVGGECKLGGDDERGCGVWELRDTIATGVVSCGEWDENDGLSGGGNPSGEPYSVAAADEVESEDERAATVAADAHHNAVEEKE
nr:hypothetical protein Iba_chr04aCG18290 [Ipomoea batatas]